MVKFKLMVGINKYFKFILFIESNKTLIFISTLKSVGVLGCCFYRLNLYLRSEIKINKI